MDVVDLGDDRDSARSQLGPIFAEAVSDLIEECAQKGVFLTPALSA
jgi:hypothetical protein